MVVLKQISSTISLKIISLKTGISYIEVSSVSIINYSNLTLNVWGPSYLGLISQYHSCWCPGFLRRQDINNHNIDYVKLASPGLKRGRISTTSDISMSRHDIKCKCIFMFPLKNLAHEELRYYDHSKILNVRWWYCCLDMCKISLLLPYYSHGWVTVTTNRSYHQPRWRRPKTVRPNNRGYQENLTVRCAHMTLTCRCHITLCISAMTMCFSSAGSENLHLEIFRKLVVTDRPCWS